MMLYTLAIVKHLLWIYSIWAVVYSNLAYSF